MTAPDYPLLALGGYETYQLAHIATYIAERLARHSGSGRAQAGRVARAEAVRDLAGAATALDTALGATEPTPSGRLPRPLDAAAYATARELLRTGPRSADVVSLAGAGGQGWAVVGHVPGIGAVGAAADTREVAEALRAHLLTRPVEELGPWAVTKEPAAVPKLPSQIDLAAFVERLNPERSDDRAVARALRGVNRRTDAAIRARFRGFDLDAPSIVQPPAGTKRATPAAGRRVVRPAVRGAQNPAGRRWGIQRPAAASSVPKTSAGP